MLAGVSVDYITRLEQGRSTSPSAQILAALARALRLSDDEREHLYLLADQPPPAPGMVPTHIGPSVQRLLDRLADTPVAVGDAAWNVLTWNPLWEALFGEPPTPSGHNRNTVWRHFSGQPSRMRLTEDERVAFEVGMVADLRVTTARYPTDPGLRSLLKDLLGIPAFERLWNEHVVSHHEMATKTVDHPTLGLLTLDCDVLTVSGSGLRIAAYTAPPGSEAADKLKLLSVIGVQNLGDRFSKNARTPSA